MAEPAPAAKAAPAPKPADDSFQATVVSATGPAQKLLVGEGKEKWEPLKVGDKLGRLSLIRTGLGAKVVLKFEDRGVITINNATKIGIADLEKKGQTAKARLGLKYGTLRAKVDGKRGKNDFRIATPVATLSVRGSEGDVGFMVDSEAYFKALEGLWSSEQEQTTGGTGTTTTTGTHTAGETATIAVDPPIIIIRNDQGGGGTGVSDPSGTTGGEQSSLGETGGGGGKRGFNTPTGGSDTTTGGTGSTVTPADGEPGHP